MPAKHILAVALPALLVSACGEGSDPERDRPARATPEAAIARWVKEGDCSLMTDRYVAQGYPSVAQGRRACQREADRTPPEPYRVQTTDVKGDEAMVVLAVRDETRLIFFLVTDRRGRWRIDGYEERRPGEGAVGSDDVIAAFETATGERLERLPAMSAATYEVLGFREFAEPPRRAEDLSDRFLELSDRFGIFYLYVAESTTEAKRLVTGGRADARGIRWERGRRWRAQKRYGNLVLSWTAGELKRTDARFDRLDEILAGR